MARAKKTAEPCVVALGGLTADEVRRQELGSVARGLVRLRQHGVRVADSWVIPTHVFRRVVARSVDASIDPDTIPSDIARIDGPRRAAEAACAIRAAAIPGDLRVALAGIVASAGHVVVFPSPTLKDEALVAAVGLDFIEGPVSNPSALEDAVRRVWARAFDERVLARLKRERVRDLAMACVMARVGSGATIASGFVLRQRIGRADVCIGEPAIGSASKQAWMAVGDGGAALRSVCIWCPPPPIAGWPRDDAPASRRRGPRSIRAPALRLDAPPDAIPLVAVAELVRAIDAVDGPRIGVVSVDGAEAALVCAHPLSGAPMPDGGDDDTIWSRLLVGDALPEFPTPLSASLYDDFVAVAGRATCALFGARVSRGAAFLGSIDGRLYLNESLLGVVAERGVTQDARAVAELTSPWANGVASDPSLLTLSVAFTRALALEQGLEREAQQFERDADAYLRWLSEMDLGILPDDGLTTTLLEARHRLFTAWQIRIAAVGVLAATSHAARRLLDRRLGSDAGRIARMIGGAATELPTTDLALAWHHVVAIVASDPAGRDAVRSGAAATTLLPEGASRRALGNFLSAYGEHGPCSAELAAVRWRENEAWLMALLRCGLGRPMSDVDHRVARGAMAVEHEFETALEHLSFFERRVLMAALPTARKLLVLADRAQRLSVRAAGALRTVLLDADRRLLRREPMLDSGTAFLCTFDEICSVLERPSDSVAVLARERRSAAQRATQRPRAPARFVGAARAEPAFVAELVHGIGSGRGNAGGPARRVTAWDPSSIGAVQPGDIVVVDAFDPALVPLLFVASGVVAERGSAWTGGLPIARELGVPVVVAVGDALARFDDGSPLEIDAVVGTIRGQDCRTVASML